ncbi:hypothetical protein [Campylobacter hyointestinalis]|uniref:hypothetical protein n=1 Tax=Campylobacter hyointestinalis TaxID=198 RepID=UPI000DCC4018|nr:hypothetical protein [Campylobacter hyointestinalis]RAZ38045.1 hypothetical protein CHL9426_07170 [Campylobacter hyointestinalis subsp. lawsonii]RAZ54650.1 hypothetical protein CHL10074_06670 [Campylobacter hyointestinalis subsp. lawsonii]RAZ63366.1 hypothetical protein CHL9767_06955 [Campylobacter hyointestinalis subsp. lawsonii]
MTENEALGAILEQINEPVTPNNEANEQIAEQTLQNDSEGQLNQVKATNAEQNEIINAQNEQINALQSKIDELSKALENALNKPQDMDFENPTNENTAQIQEQLNAMKAEQDELRARADFNTAYQNFTQRYPTIDGDMLLKFAKDNGYEHLLGDFKAWDIIAKLMINEAKPKQEPDPITSSSSSGVFTQKGIRDDASDIEIGAEILSLSKGVAR